MITLQILSLLLLIFTPPAIYADSNRIENYQPQGDAFKLKEISKDLSGITYNYDTNSYFLIQNNTAKIYEYTSDFSKHLRTIRIINPPGGKDTEGIAYIGNDQFVIVNEANYAFTITIINKNLTKAFVDESETIVLPKGRKNKGLEGVCYKPAGNNNKETFFTVQEKKPMKLYKFYHQANSNTKIKIPFNIAKVLKGEASDISGCTFNKTEDTLIVVSHESSKLLELNLKGQLLSQLPLSDQNHGGADQYEGVTLNYEKLVVVSEPNLVRIYTLKK